MPSVGVASARTRGLSKNTRLRQVLLGLAGLRIVAGIVAIPLAAVLYRDHFLILVLMRPTKEVLLFGGFLARQDKVHLLQILAAAVPLAILGVWHAFALGRMYGSEIRSAKLPGIAGRILPPSRIKALCAVLKKHGAKTIVIGRLAVFPSALLGAAAGSSKMKARTFLPADAIGGLLSILEAAGAGYLLGEAYKSGKPWLTGLGLAVLIGFAVVIGRTIRRT